MPARAYSERFISALTQGYSTYFVPPGKRAVVMTITVYNNTATAQTAAMVVGGVATWQALIPGSSGVFVTNLRVVVYAGEKLELWLATSTMTCSAHGYLLDAPA